MFINYYIAKLDLRQCSVDIRINDVPLLRQNIESDLMMEIPINHLIEISGNQILTIKIYPRLGELKLSLNARCNVEIWRYDGNGVKILPIEEVCKSYLSTNKLNKVNSFMFDKKVFIATVSYEILRWSGCEELKDNKNYAPAIAAYYQQIGQLLSSKQYDKYLECIKEREYNICTALSLSHDEIDIRNQMLFECLNNGFVLQPLKGGKQMQFYGNRRIVSVLDHDMKSALRFINEKTGEILAIELFLGIKKGDKGFSII